MIVLHSTSASIKENQISLLALFEVVIATGLSILVYRHFDILSHIIISALLAPLTLLRTPASTRYGLYLTARLARRQKRVFSNVTKKIQSGDFLKTISGRKIFELPIFVWVHTRGIPRPVRTALFYSTGFILSLLFPLIAIVFNLLFMIFMAIFMIVSYAITTVAVPIFMLAAAAVIRALAIGRSILFEPLEILANIPVNWRRIILCTDSSVYPELVPGINDIGAKRGLYANIAYVRPDLFWKSSVKAWQRLGPLHRAMSVQTIPYLMIGFLILLIPAQIYRWSLKSTAVVWSPLLWAFRPIRWVDNPAHFATGILQLGYYKLSRIYSLIVIALYAVKALLWIGLLQLTSTNQSLGILIVRFVSPDTILTWHVAAVINALLTWIVYFRAETYLHDIAGHVKTSDIRIKTFFKIIFMVRNILSLYVCFCALYILASIVTDLNIPPLRIILIPM